MSEVFTVLEKEILIEVAREVDEVYVESRKGKPQTKYIMEVASDAEYWCNKIDDFVMVPESLVGTWMMNHAYDLSYDTLNDCIKSQDWVKCREVEKVITVWEEV